MSDPYDVPEFFTDAPLMTGRFDDCTSSSGETASWHAAFANESPSTLRVSFAEGRRGPGRRVPLDWSPGAAP